MSKTKKLLKVSAIVVATAVISVGVGVTLGYLAGYDNKDNTMKIGHETAKVSEVNWSEPEMLQMSNSFDKEVAVKNEGSVPCFVRVYAEFSDSTIAPLASIIYNNDTEHPYTWENFKNGLLSTAETPITTDWVFIPDTLESEDAKLRGYFYYTKVVPVNESTSNLFTDVKVDYSGGVSGVSNIDLIRDFEMIIYSETVQATETGAIQYSNVSTYGHVYTDAEWKDAWKSYLKVPAT